ncbi:MAG: hypothetical protein ABW216_11135 [Candidatus Rokuibacteriota bacterium]
MIEQLEEEIAMAQKVRLTPQSLKSVLEDVRRDHGRVERLTKALTERGFRAVVEDMFDLSDQQRAQLDAVLSKEYDTICRDACLIALKTGGAIKYAVSSGKERTGVQALRANVECEGDPDELHCGVTFECPI